jgi:hypothetical protein
MKMSRSPFLMMFWGTFIVVSLFSCGSNGGRNSSSSNASLQASSVEEAHYSTDANLQNPLIGAWVSGGYRLTFNADNTYERDFNSEGVPIVLGSVKVSGNVILVTDDSGGNYSCINSPAGEIISGAYTYTINGRTLTFNLVHDSCSERAAFLGLSYRRQ